LTVDVQERTQVFIRAHGLEEEKMKSDRIVKRSEISQLTGLSLATLRRLEAIGEFPRRRALSTRAVGWRESEVLAWLRTRERVAPAKVAAV
jgi:prophage regulatory protein